MLKRDGSMNDVQVTANDLEAYNFILHELHKLTAPICTELSDLIQDIATNEKLLFTALTNTCINEKKQLCKRIDILTKEKATDSAVLKKRIEELEDKISGMQKLYNEEQSYQLHVSHT